MFCSILWPYLKVFFLIESVLLYLYTVSCLSSYNRFALSSSAVTLHDYLSFIRTFAPPLTARLIMFLTSRWFTFSVFVNQRIAPGFLLFQSALVSLSFPFFRPFLLGLQRYEPFLISQTFYFLFF